MTFGCYVLASAALLLMVCNTEASGCSENDATCMSSVPPSSLLQKDFRRGGSSRLGALQPEIQIPECWDGAMMQGRCWYLSEVGESCYESCASHNRSFSYIVADVNDPVTPHLVGHIPRQQQEPWTALECYVPSEDRYHTANANAAKHSLDDVGDFTHENCKLACPCSLALGGAPPQPTEAPLDPPDTPLQEDDCKWIPAYSCVEEFDYEGTHYTGCTATGRDMPWCSNTEVYQGSWNNCVYTCANMTDPELPERDGDNLCHWEMAANCSDVFFYKGRNYSSCTDADYPTPWCSYDSIHRGGWTTCSRVCTEASNGTSNTTAAPTNDTGNTTTPAPPSNGTSNTTTAPTNDTADATTTAPPSNGTGNATNDTGNVTTPAPTEDEDPCARHPESENDSIGESVSLDEAGYKVAAAAESPINMKRFVCRVVDKIECQVVDYSALVAFIPYYSGLESHQTYKKLEGELTTICHAGGKWVEPISGSDN